MSGPSAAATAAISSSVRWPISSRRPTQLIARHAEGDVPHAIVWSSAWCTAVDAPLISSSNIPRISRAFHPCGMSPAKVSVPASRSMASNVRTTRTSGWAGSQISSG